MHLYSWLIVYSDLCCFFSLNYCFAAAELHAGPNFQTRPDPTHESRDPTRPDPTR